MPQVLQQKFNLTDPFLQPAAPKLILTLGLEEYLAALYSARWFLPEFYVMHLQGTKTVEAVILKEQPAALLVDADFYFYDSQARGLFDYLKRTFPRLPILTVGMNNNAEEIKQLMSAGVVSHINRKFSRPQDVVAVTKMILNY